MNSWREMINSDTLAVSPIPFSQTDNPVMSVVAFLASVVNPGVAAAAAQAAIRELGIAHDGANDKSAAATATTMANNNGNGPSLPDGKMKPAMEKAATAALAASATKAKVLALFEEREMQRLVNSVIEAQLRKIDLKMTQFEELELIMENERKDLERQRQQLFADRLTFQRAFSQLDEKTLRE